MIQTPLRCVVDASVAIKLFIDEPFSDQADALFLHLVKDTKSRFFVPELFYPECANILWKYVRRFGYIEVEAKKSLTLLKALALDRLLLTDIIDDAFNLALANDITVYDACYLATANLVGVPLITADERLARKIGKRKQEIYVLGRFKIP